MHTLLLAILPLGIGQPNPAPADKVALQALVKGNTDFALDLHRQLSKEPGNLCYSPWSISMVLAMTSAGAQGNTLQEMVKTLHLPEARLTHPAAAALLRQVRTPTGCELNAANALFVAKDIPWRKEFLDLTQTHYDSSIFGTDFRTQPESARRSINAWVEGQTRQRIRGLIPRDGVNAHSKVVLVNALYFKGEWESPFPKANTKRTLFFATPKDSVLTPMMFQRKAFFYAETKTMQVLGVPYKGNELMMMFVLPRASDGLANLEKNLTGGDIQTWLERLALHPVDVYLPPFKLEQTVYLEATLEAMGMRAVFRNGSDLGGMTTTREPLKVDRVIHKTFLELQEEGTEAAAATAVLVLTPVSHQPPPPPQPEPPVFRADHPFLFSIVDRRSGSLLFLGRVSDPTR